MDAIKLTGHVGSDGILRLELPVDVTDQDLEVVLVIQTHPDHESPADANVWPIERPEQGVLEKREEWLAFIEETAGSLADDPIE